MSSGVKKTLGVIYFVVLFFILGSYIYTSLPDNMIRLHVVTADSLSMRQTNVIGVQARNLDNGSVFHNWSVKSQWVSASFEPVSEHAVTKPLPVDGSDILDMPPVPDVPLAALEVQLIDPDNHVVKSALVSADVFASMKVTPVTAQEGEVKSNYIFVDIPSTFILEQPNEVRLVAYENEKPYEGTIDIEQVYGAPAKFPSHVKASPSGITPIKIALNSAADFKMTAGNQTIYPSFVIHEKPIHVEMNSTSFLPASAGTDENTKSNLIATVVPVGQMPKLYIDFFDEDAWIDRQIIEASRQYRSIIPIHTRYQFGEEPSVLYVRLSASAYPTAETSQTFALIASRESLDCKAGALTALKFLDLYLADHPEAVLMKLQAKSTSDCTKLKGIQEEALTLLARHHDPQLAMRVKTEDADALAYDARKAKHKSIANVILVCWFALGVITACIIVFTQMRKRRLYWEEAAAKGDAEYGKRIPQVSPILAFVLFFLIIGLCWSLYYMMQLL